MIIKFIPESGEDAAVHQLPEPDMVVDPRPIYHDKDYKFGVTVNGTTITITRIDRKEYQGAGWYGGIRFRIYSRNEFRYSFESTKYLYQGVEGEITPEGTTDVIVKDGVEVIEPWAFCGCTSISKIVIPNTVTRIKQCAFMYCVSLRCIQLPSNLRSIKWRAFHGCSSLKAIYLPPTVTEIVDLAFSDCKSLRIVNIPDSTHARDVLEGCDDLLTDELTNAHYDQYEWLIRNRCNPLHNLCWNPSVTADNIQQYIQQNHYDDARATTKDMPRFTPLHLLAANPSVTGQLITSYLQLAPDVATVQDNIGDTPLHMLCSVPYFSDELGGAIRAYIEECDEGKRVALMKNDKGMTPLDYLCEKSYNDMPFLKNKSFAGLIEWWYDCVGINLFAGMVQMTNVPSRKRKSL